MPHPVIRGALVWALLLVLTAAGTAGTACRRGDVDGGLLVLAAASLTEALEEIGANYTESSGIEVRFSYGGSDSLAGQIRRGAPADAVIFAGEGPLDGLEASGLIEPGSRRNVAGNRLVVIVSSRSRVNLDSLDALASGDSGKVAIADPELAPAGRYAKAALQAAGVWDRVAPRIIPGLDVRNAAAAVTAGNAEFGLVYQTDAAAVEGVRVAYLVPADLHPAIVYPAAVASKSDRRSQAAGFLRYLTGPEAGAVLSRHGFQPAR